MATRDEPIDPQEVLAAAEAAHLAARRTVPIPATGRRRPVPEQPTVRLGGAERSAERPTESVAGAGPDRVTVPLDRAADGRATVRLPGRPARPGPVRRRAPLPLAAVVAAGWAALVSFAPVLLLVAFLQAAETGLGFGGPLRVASAGWLLAHGVPVHTPAGPVGFVPLLLTALAGWRVARAGVHVTRAIGARGSGSVRQAGLVAGSVAVGYGLAGTLVATLAGGPGWGTPVPRSGLTLAGFGLLAAGYGALRATGVLARWQPRLPVVLRDGARAGLVAACGVLAAGAALAGIAVAAGGGAAAEILAAYRTNVAGQAGLTLLCLAYAPNLAGWAAAYLVGPGFAVGAGSVVRSSEVTLGWLPPVPVFAALPDGPLPTVGAVLLAVPVAAGAAAGWLLARWAPGWGPATLAAVVSGVVAGGLLGLVAAVSGGPLGGGRLATFGPDPLLVAGFAAVTVTAGAVLGAAAGAVTARRPGGRTVTGGPPEPEGRPRLPGSGPVRARTTPGWPRLRRGPG
jgi:hypothetical protein